MAETGNRAVVDRFVAAHQVKDWDTLESLLHPDYVEEWPQSGERIRGGANLRAILEHYPGGLPRTGLGTRRVTGSEREHVMTVMAGFSYHTVRVTGSSDTFTFEGTATYADGSSVYVVRLQVPLQSSLAS